MSDELFGYEWGWDCGNCGQFNGLSGLGFNHPKVNDESGGRDRELEDGDVLECTKCGRTVKLTFEVMEDGE